jgi:signal transduction histidine kinase
MSPSTLIKPQALHPTLSGLLERHGAEGLDAVLGAVSQAFVNIDRELGQAMDALDQSMEEAVALNNELKERARTLELALGAKDKALAELGQAKIQLMNQEKLASIGTLAAGISHEINTPTQFVSDNLSFLQDAFKSILLALETAERGEKLAATEEGDLAFFRAEIPQALSQSLEGMERVAHIVRSMKEFSHPGKGGKRAVDLNRNVLSTITVCRNEWKYVAELQTQLDESLPPLPCAPEELNQVVLNLIVNAAHAIQDSGRESAKGRITVSTRREADGVQISVSDNGCGIPDAVRARVFDPFFTTKEVGRGTGQGLALAHAVVVEKHQGRISFDTAVGEGTTFHLWLPLAGSLT